MAAAEKKGGPGLAIIFGKAGGKPPAKPDDEAAEGEAPMAGGKGADDPAYQAAYQEYQDNPSMETFWRAVKACTEAY